MNPAKLARLREIEQIYNFDDVSQAESVNMLGNQNNPYPLNNPNLISALGKPPLNYGSSGGYSKRNILASERSSVYGAKSNSAQRKIIQQDLDNT